MGCPGAWGKLVHEKNLKSKISWHCLFNLGIVNIKYKERSSWGGGGRGEEEGEEEEGGEGDDVKFIGLQHKVSRSGIRLARALPRHILGILSAFYTRD
jgi:hypothetical protein